jgi:acetyltransferase-like isoleucine patch superfamily enzyme
MISAARRAISLLVAMVRVRLDPVAFHRSQGVRIGARVDLYGAGLFTFGSEPYLVTVGDDVTISHEVDFITHDGGLRVVRDEHPGAFHYGPITVEDGAFIGAHAVLLPGVTIGAGAVVGAGSVVTRDVPPRSVVAGVPAKVVKSVEEYGVSRRAEWIDTEGLSAAEKERLLRRHFSR